MAWWVWMIIGIGAVMLLIDCLIIGGKNPREWKGGGKQ